MIASCVLEPVKIALSPISLSRCLLFSLPEIHSEFENFDCLGLK